MSKPGHETITANCPFAQYMRRLGRDGRIFNVSVARAAQTLGISPNTVRNQLASLQRQNIIRYDIDSPGIMSVRFVSDA